MLSKEEVQHIAKLARVGVKDGEVEKLRSDLSAVLDSFAELQAADVSNVEPFELMPGVVNALRDDASRVPDPDERARIISLFPRKEGNSLKVKAVF